MWSGYNETGVPESVDFHGNQTPVLQYCRNKVVKNWWYMSSSSTAHDDSSFWLRETNAYEQLNDKDPT